MTDLSDFIDRPTWMANAACADHPTSLFYRRTRAQIAAAVAICRRCPVRIECAGYALATDEAHGVWGGLSEHQRRQIRTGQDLTA